MKSGPTLNACTRRPRAVRAAKSASVTVVLPTPLEVPAMIKRGTIMKCLQFRIVIHSNSDKNRAYRCTKVENFLIFFVEQVICSNIGLHALFTSLLGIRFHHSKAIHLF